MRFFKKEPKKEETAAPKEVRAEEKKPQGKPTERVAVKKDMGRALGILIKPLVTEKTSFLGQYGQYVFEVAPKANKTEIAKAIWHAYGVKPAGVNLVRVRGHEVRYGKTVGVTRKRKKAIVTLKPGDKIEIHEGV
jgi:large subunit ribosomal protein L23